MRKKLLCYGLVLSCVMGVLQPNMSYAQSTRMNEDGKSYLVICENKEEKADIEEVIEEDDEWIDTENASIVCVNSDQIEEIQEQCDDNIVIEEDIVIKANNIEQKITSQKASETEKSTWNLDMIKSSDETDAFLSNKVKIAIIDSGINWHEDINVVDSINYEEEGEVNPFFIDASGHGLSVAGIINDCATANGIEDNVEIYSARVLDDDGNALVSNVVKAIKWAVDNEVDIINMSFGTCNYSYALETAIKEAYGKGVLLVASSGNNQKVEYPAAFEEVISVGAVGPDAKVCEFSAPENQVELLAPGECIESIGMFENQIYSGTSIAAPHVVGAAAKIYATKGNANNRNVREALQISSRTIDNSVEDDNYGLIDSETAYDVYDQIHKNDGNTPEYIEEAIHDSIDNDDIKTYEDDCMVQRNWIKHGKMTIETLTEQSDFDKYKFKALISGARYPDNADSVDNPNINNHCHNYAGLSKYQELHGGGMYCSGKYNGTNYAACYCLMIRCANALYSYAYNNGNKTMTKLQLKQAVEDNDYSRALCGYTNASFGKVSYDVIIDVALESWKLAKNNSEFDGSINNCRRFLYGMAMHIITDAFAHSSYRKINGQWKNIQEYSGAWADDTDICNGRFEVAKECMSNTWNRLRGSNRNNTIFADFYAPKAIASGHYSAVTNTQTEGYLMGNFLPYLNSCTNNLGEGLFCRFAQIDYSIYTNNRFN